MKFMAMVWAAFLARVKPGLDQGEAGLHEHDQEAGDQVQTMLMAILLWPTAPMSSARVGLPASAVTSVAPPVWVPSGSPLGSTTAAAAGGGAGAGATAAGAPSRGDRSWAWE